ncbi:hypothetical protein Tco_1442800, partial [Tanacetum coccineum]
SAFATLSRDESHKNSHNSSKTTKAEPTAFAARPSNNNNWNPTRPGNTSKSHDSVAGIKAMGLEVSSIRHIQRIRYGVLEFLKVGTTFDIFQNIHIPYLQYGVLTSSGYGILIFFPLWSLVSAGMDTLYLP